MTKGVLALLVAALAHATLAAQGPANLLANSAAERGAEGWRTNGQATIEEFEGNRSFVVRNGAQFSQEADLPPSAAGKYVLFIAHMFGDRTAPAGDITDRPYLYGLTRSADGRRILLHNQAPTMGGLAAQPRQWTKAWGVFQIPEGASSISYQLKQGLRRGTPRDGSAARFDDVGLFVFDTRAAAEAFVARYR